MGSISVACYKPRPACEVFEWVSREAIEGAHQNPVVLDLWKRFEAACWYETPSNLAEFKNMFAHFQPI